MNPLRYLPLLACLLLLPGVALADSDARDFEALAYSPNNTVAALGYFRHVSSTDANISQSLAVLRAAYILRSGPWAFVPFDAQLPMVDVTSYVPVASVGPAFAAVPNYLNFAAHGSGVGDLEYFPTVAYVIAEGAHGENHTVLALNPRVTIPIGTYDANKLINIGSNRATFKPQIGIGQRFATAFTAELVANLAFHTENEKFVAINPMTGAIFNTKMSQSPDIVVDAHVAVDLSRTFFFATSYYLFKSGEEKLTAMNDKVAAASITTQSLRFGLGVRLAPTTLVLMQYNQDIAASNNGPIERFFGLRLSHVFVNQPEPSVPQPQRSTPEPTPKVNPDSQG